MPSAESGSEVRRNLALNCWPWVRSLTHSPEAVIHSPAAMVAEWPTSGGDNDLTNRFRKIASSLSHDWQIRLSWSGRRLVLAGPSE
jgi:hypothetical protein